MSKTFVGIDFGTTNSTIAVVNPDGRIISLGPIPSLMAWENHQVVAYGQKARDLVHRGSPPYPLRDLKMHLEAGTVRIGSVMEDVIPLVADYLQELFDLAGIRMEDVHVVIGTPVRVGRMHRENLRKALYQAGLLSAQLVYEPTAALLGSIRDVSQLLSETVLVVDWGGGTLDIAFIAVDGDQGFREISVDGDVNDLGGSLMDREIARQLLARSSTARQAVESLSNGQSILLEAIERLKVEFLEEGSESEPRLVPGLPTKLFLNPELVFSVAHEFAVQARESIEIMLERMKIAANDVTKILFAGGVSQSPIIRDEIMFLFPEAEEIHDDNPQLSSGIGCAKLARRSFSLELASDFAVRQSDDSLCVLLKEGQSVATNRYRKTEFMVTDVSADEAIFDFGLCHQKAGTSSLWAIDGHGFTSLHQTFIRVGQAELQRAAKVPDIVEVFTGLDENLTIAIFLRSQRSEASVQDFVTGVPLTIRMGEPT